MYTSGVMVTVVIPGSDVQVLMIYSFVFIGLCNVESDEEVSDTWIGGEVWECDRWQ